MQNIAYTQKGFGGMLKQGWLAYDFDSKTKFKQDSPFGITTYNSHNWFFQS
jgi:hypothetical protein